MRTGQILAVALLAQSLLLPAWAAIPEPEPQQVRELTQGEAAGNAYRHTGDVAVTNYRGSAEQALKEVREQVQQQGDRFYRVTRLQMMENSTWSANAATYLSAQSASNINQVEEKEG